MKYLGKAKLVEHPHESGITAKSWDLSPWGGPMVFLGAATSPLPPAGTTVDKANLRVDTGTGEVWQLELGDPPPSVGRTGKIGGPFQLLPLLGIAWFAWFMAKRR